MKPRVDIQIRLILGIFIALWLLWMVSIGISEAKFYDLLASQVRDDIVIAGALDNNNSIGQTFIAQKPYLSSIKFLLTSYQNEQMREDDHHIFVHLQDSRHIEIASETYSISSTAEKLEVEFSFSPQPDSLNKNYYLLIETDAPHNSLSILGSLFDAYQSGDIYLVFVQK
jgi:hypothetical protein